MTEVLVLTLTQAPHTPAATGDVIGGHGSVVALHWARLSCSEGPVCYPTLTSVTTTASSMKPLHEGHFTEDAFCPCPFPASSVISG